MARLAGRKIIITGGASGIGRATARLFRREGAAVAILDRSDNAAKIVGAVLYRFWPGGVSWELVRPDGIVDADVHRFSRGAWSLREAPLLPVGWLTSDQPEGRR